MESTTLGSRSLDRQHAALQALFSLFAGVKLAMRQQLLVGGDVSVAPMHLFVLRMCLDQPGITQQEIAQQTGRDKGQVARLVKDLVDAGLLVRTPHPEDRRSHRLTASKSAKAACEQLRRAEAAVAAQLFRGMTAMEVDALAQRLVTLRDGLVR